MGLLCCRKFLVVLVFCIQIMTSVSVPCLSCNVPCIDNAVPKIDQAYNELFLERPLGNQCNDTPNAFLAPVCAACI